jgi:SAM-dependent methyltransferase
MSLDHLPPPPRCRYCGTFLEHVFADLGVTPLANRNLRVEDIPAERSFPLVVRVCHNCFLVQVDDSISPQELFSDYDYFSSYSRDWLDHAARYSRIVRDRFGIGPGSFVVEIGSNDGYLLRNFSDATVLGIEPAANVAAVAVTRGIPTDVSFFGRETAARLARNARKADLVVVNNVFGHVPAIRDFVAGLAELLEPRGIATFEFPHLLQLIDQVQFDTIYHEHFFYFSLMAAETVLGCAGLRVFDVEELATHGGSLRLFVCHAGHERAETPRLRELRARERERRLHMLSGYQGFAERIEETKRRFAEFLAQARSAGRTIAGYGAAAKGTTFLNAAGVGYPAIFEIYDRNPAKQGKVTPGGHIPIVSPEKIMQSRPDDVVILAWNWAQEVVRTMPDIAQWGGRWIIATPSPHEVRA